MNSQNPSDIISIIQETSDYFSLNEVESISQSDYNLLLSNKAISYSGKIDEYVSFIFIIYKNKYYPFLFYKVKQNSKNSISLIGKPIYSKPTLSLLSRVGIEKNEIHKSSDINSTIISLLGLIEKKGLEVQLSSGINFYSTKSILTQDTFEYLSEYLYIEKDEKISSIIKSKNNDENLDVDFFNFTKKINEYTSESKISKVIFDNPNLCLNYIYNLVSENLSNEAVAILTNNIEEKKEITKKLKKIFGDNLVYNFAEIQKFISDEKQLDNKTEFSLKDLKLKKEYDNFKENSNTFFESIQQLEGIYRKNKLKDLNFEEIEESENKVKFDINTSGYTRKDFNVDNNFFKEIRGFSSILESHVTNHIYYGFNDKYDKECYSEVKQLINEIIKCLNELLTEIKNNPGIVLDDNEITSFKQIENLNSYFQLILQCRNIPLELFNEDLTDKINQIEELKNAFQKLSSSKLVIQNLADKKILDINLADLISRWHSHNYLKKYSARRQVNSYLKIKKRNQVKPLFDVIEKYAFSQVKIDELLPKYIENFDNKISTLDGLKDIENMYRNVVKFNQMSAKNSFINISNPIIKNLLTDDNIFNKYRISFEKVFDAYNNCKRLVNKYIDYFLYDKKDFVHTPITDNLAFFKNKLKGTSKDLEEYISFVKLEKNVSPALLSAIEKCIELQLSLDSLSTFFFSNLMNINYSESKRELFLFKSEMDKNKLFYLQNLKLIDVYADLERKEKVNIDEKILSKLNENKNILKDNYFDDLLNKKIREVLSNRFILVLTIDDLVGLDDNVFCNLIVYDKSNYDNKIIFDLIRLSKKTYFVEQQDNINQFTRNCSVGDFSVSYLIKNQFDFSKFDIRIYNQLEELLLNKNLKLVRDDFIYIVDEKRERKYILIPSTSLSGPIVAKELNEAFSFIYSNTHNKIMYLDVTKFSFEKKEAFSEMLLPYYKY